jgi:hypothetical protein
MNSRRIVAALLAAGLAGCAIHQDVKPVGALGTRQICVVENPAVSQDGFLKVYKRSLEDKGFEVRQIAPASPVTACPVTTTYTANWKWDWALYMKYAAINVYNNGQPAGEAVYDADANALGRYIKAENKIRELVNQLFPGGAR